MTLFTFTADIPSSFMALPRVRLEGVRGSPSRGTKLSTVFHITDKLSQMGSAKCFLHTLVISVVKLVLPSSWHSAPCVPWEDSYQCVQVTEGNANLT